MEKRSIFIKQYTRDTLLIVQEAWAKGFINDYNNKENPYQPTQIYYINNGAVEIWENQKALNWFKKRLLKKNLGSQSFYFESMERYLFLLATMKRYQKRKVLKSKEQLQNFINLVFEMSRLFLIFYFSAMDKETPLKIKKHAKQLRKEDNFYEDSHKLIKNTLNYLFPRSKGLEIGIMTRDLKRFPKPLELKDRKNNFIMVPGSLGSIIDLKSFLKNNKNFVFISDKVKKIDFLRGQSINKGKITGRVRIVRTRDKIKDVKKGEILVSPMTTPDFLPAMRKAAAFVTDEGGILCHAAVVAREFNKPCVIGTKVATQVLKDGDLVEVDAGRGVIKKIII